MSPVRSALSWLVGSSSSGGHTTPGGCVVSGSVTPMTVCSGDSKAGSNSSSTPLQLLGVGVGVRVGVAPS